MVKFDGIAREHSSRGKGGYTTLHWDEDSGINEFWRCPIESDKAGRTRVQALLPYVCGDKEMANCFRRRHGGCLHGHQKKLDASGGVDKAAMEAPSGSPVQGIISSSNLAFCTNYNQAHKDALSLALNALQVPLKQEERWLFALPHYHAGIAYCYLQAFDQAVRHFTAVLSLPSNASLPLIHQAAHLALACLAAGEADQEQVMEHLSRADDSIFESPVKFVRAKLALALGRLDEAKMLAGQCYHKFSLEPPIIFHWRLQSEVLSLLAQIAAALGEQDEEKRIRLILTEFNDGATFSSCWGGVKLPKSDATPTGHEP